MRKQRNYRLQTILEPEVKEVIEEYVKEVVKDSETKAEEVIEGEKKKI